MALMDKPTDPNPENASEMDNVVSLDEEGDVEQENLEYSGVVTFIEGQFRRSKDRRVTDEDRWLMAYRNYRWCRGS